LLSSARSALPRDLHSFPTRRSSDLVPGLAEAWEVSEDGRTYTFRIRDNARFHNGRPVTAHDAAFSLRRLLDEETGAPRRADYASDRKSTRLNSSHVKISYAVFCLKK